MMYEKWEDFLEEKVKSIRMDSKVLSVEEIQQNVHSLFGIEYSKEKVKDIMSKKKGILEIKEDIFICKECFENFIDSIKEEEDKVKKINRYYFIRLTSEEEKKVLEKIGIEGSQEITLKPEAELENEEEVDNEKTNETKGPDIYKELGLSSIDYDLDDVTKNVLSYIEKTEKSIKLNKILESENTSEEVKLLSKYAGENISKILSKRSDLFYMASNKNVFFKPFLSGLIITRKDSQIMNVEEVEKILKEVLGSKSINRKELGNFLLENKSVFKVKDGNIEVLWTLEEYRNLVKFKFGEIPPKVEELVGEDKVETYLDKNIKELAQDRGVSEESLIFDINKKRSLIVVDGVVKRYEKKSWDKDLLKIANAMEFIGDNISENFSKEQLEKIVKNMISKQPMGKKDVLERCWLYQDKISEDLLSEILLNNKEFKRIDRYKYTLKDNLSYSEYKNDLREEWMKFIENFKDSEKKVLKLRILEKLTLEEAGKKLGVTRERVRQIAKRIEKRMLIINTEKFYPYFECIENIFKATKVISKSSLEEQLKEEECFEGINTDEIFRIYEVLNQREIYKYYESYYGVLEKDKIEKAVSRVQNKIISYEEFSGIFKSLGIESEAFIKKYIENHLRICKCKDLVLCLDKKVGITDKLRMVFEVEKRELTLSESALLYNKYYEEDNPERNIFVRLEDRIFTRVFTGTYRLSSWGGETHVFSKDLAVNCLREMRRPLYIEEIVDEVKDKTRANETTIRVFTSMSNETFAYTHGEWALKEWADDPELSRKYHISKNRIDASEGSTVHKSHKGNFSKNNKTVILYQVNEMFFKHGGHLNLGIELPYIMEGELDILYDNNSFERRISNSTKIRAVYGMKEIIEYMGLKMHDYFYLVYINDSTVRLYTWDEFENENFYDDKDILGIEIPWDERRKDEGSEDEWTEDHEPYNEEPVEVEVVFKTYGEAERYGLDNGFVKKPSLQGIDYDEEYEVEDIYEAIEELQDKGIKITEE